MAACAEQEPPPWLPLASLYTVWFQHGHISGILTSNPSRSGSENRKDCNLSRQSDSKNRTGPILQLPDCWDNRPQRTGISSGTSCWGRKRLEPLARWKCSLSPGKSLCTVLTAGQVPCRTDCCTDTEGREWAGPHFIGLHRSCSLFKPEPYVSV